MTRTPFAGLAMLLASALSAQLAAAQPPPAPGNFTATPIACVDIQLSWTDVPNETVYALYRDNYPIALAVLGPDVTSYLDQGPPNNTHTYCLIAANADGESDPVCASATFLAPSALMVEARNWYQDTFTSNETFTSTLLADYDTTSAWIRTGLNLATLTGDFTRLDLPADTVVAEAPGANLRLDLVFRIRPGVGNHVTIGNRSSSLRRVPTSPTAAVANAASANFWESYLADNGAVGTGGNGVSGPGHAAGKWDRNLWNSARCDTAETNLFPTLSRHPNLSGLAPGRYASMYHESDPRYLTLGAPKKRCFLVDPSGVINSTNITCGTGTFPPAWTVAPGSGLPASEDGLGPGMTHEFTPIIPDGQLTPGSHVEYFLRVSDESAPLTMLASNPDTSQVVPQPGCMRDCSRWAELSVLPDRWQQPSFGGMGMACMLVVDLDDGRGNECAWVSIADSLGLTHFTERGAHNGWSMAPPGADPNDPAYHVRAHGGQAGTTWDLFSVRGSRDTLTGNAGSLGSRLAPRCSGCPASGRESRQGPTLTMLRFYRVVVVLTGSRRVEILGPTADRGQNDWEMLWSFLTLPGGTPQPRGLWIMGSGFAYSEDFGHSSFMSNILRAGLRSPDYAELTGNSAASVTLTVTYPAPPPPWLTFGVRSRSLDVLQVETPFPSGSQAVAYDPAGGNSPPYVASVHGPESGGQRNFRTLLNGFDLADLGSNGNNDTEGRKTYIRNTGSVFAGGIGCWPPPPNTDVDPSLTPTHQPSFRLGNNPLIEGVATVHLTLATGDHARIVIHDVAGRVLKVLADRSLEAGAHEFTWDGSDDAGRRVASGVYLVRATTASGRAEARSMVVLR